MEPLIDHIEVTVRDMATAVPFYDRLLPLLGFDLTHRSDAVLERHEKHVVSYEHPRVGFAITSPRPALAGEVVQRRRPGALHHLAFRVPTRADVDRLHLELKVIGAAIEGPPRVYPEYTPAGYYAVFFRDPDGIKYEIVCTTEGGDAAPGPPGGPADLLARFGQIDIYLFDQLLRGRITPRMRVLDAGCGEGRNSHFLMRSGGEVFGIDADSSQITRIRALAAEVAPSLPSTNFLVGRLDELPFEDGYFAAVVCSAVLHFARDEAQFERMVFELWRVLGDGGVLFARLASTIGIEERVRLLRGRTHRLPDGSDRFLVDEEYLLQITARLGGRLLDPLKTTNVQNLRAMTTWVVSKGAGEIA